MSTKREESEVAVQNLEEKEFYGNPELSEFEQLRERLGAKKALRRLLFKIDIRLVPLLTFIYTVSSIDKNNIGNAKVLNMLPDLGMTPYQFSIALTVFFFPYALFEVPSNIVLKILRPKTWLTIMICAWGIVVTLTGIVHNYAGLLTCRIFLGICEAGLFPASMYMFSCWYQRSELQLRMGIFITASSFAGAFSGLLAYVLGLMNGVGGLEGWRWIFIMEGIATVLIGGTTYFILPSDKPAESGKWLSDEEKRYLTLRVWYDGNANRGMVQVERFSWKILRDTLLDWKIWAGCPLYWANSLPLFSLAFFLPTIVADFGYSGNIANLLTIPIYAVALIVTIFVAWYTDRIQQRAYCLISCYALAIIGLILLMTIPISSVGGRYFALILMASGALSAPGALISWVSNNLSGSWKRAIGLAFMMGGGNLAGAIGSNIFIASEAPSYPTGFGVCLATTSFAFCVAIVMRICLSRLNKRRTAMTDEQLRRFSPEQLEHMGPLFKYVL